MLETIARTGLAEPENDAFVIALTAKCIHPLGIRPEAAVRRSPSGLVMSTGGSVVADTTMLARNDKAAKAHSAVKPRGPKYVLPVAVHDVRAGDLAFLTPQDQLKLPGKVYAAGDVSLLTSGFRVAIIGSRGASDEGLRRARKLAMQLAAHGVTIVSGLAKGIDRAAHEGALAVTGGRTIAVIGTPLDKVYPVEHSELQMRIAREHLVVSQLPIGAPVYPSSFVARNRTMALLSHASVIIEAGDTSGTLSQAAETQRSGRTLFFLKSVLDNATLTWPAKFQAAGAIVLQDVQQVLDVLKPR